MADSATQNHNFILPEIGASKDSWGTKLNQNFTSLDSLLKVGLGTFVNRAGDTMTGLLTLPTTVPTAGTHAAHKSYVDGAISYAIASSETKLRNDLVPKTNVITAGNGLTGGGDLSASRTIALGPPLSITGSSTNSATEDSHTHALNLGVLPLRSADVVATDVAPRLLYINSGDTTSFSRIAADALAIGFGIARVSTTITAGNGLTGGGDLSANRTVALGTPSSITATSTNSVTATSHTHALSAQAVAELIAGLSSGGVGTYSLLVHDNTGGADILINDVVSGAVLRFTSASGNVSGVAPSGSWKAMSRCSTSAAAAADRTTLFLRVS